MFSPITSLISNTLRKRKMEKQGLTGSRKRKKQEESLSVVVDKSKSLKILLLLLLFISSLSVLLIPNTKKSTQFVIGQTTHQTVYSEIDFSYEDTVQTEKKRNDAMNRVPYYYRIDKNKTNTIISNLKLFLSELIKRHNLEEKGQAYLVNENEISRNIAEYSKESLNSILLMIQYVEQDEFINLVKSYLDDGVISSRTKEDDKLNHYNSKVSIIDSKNRIITDKKFIGELATPATVIDQIVKNVENYFDITNRKIIKFSTRRLLSSVIDSNLFFDKDKYQKERVNNAKKIDIIISDFKKRDLLVNKGVVINDKIKKILLLHCEKIKEANATFNFLNKVKYSVIISFIFMVLIGTYIYHIHPEVTRSNKKTWLLGFVIILMLFLNFGSIYFFNTISPSLTIPPSFLSYAIPIAIGPILLSILLGLRVAIYAGLYVSVITALQLEESFDFIVVGFAVSCIAAFVIRKAINYKMFFIRTVLITFAMLTLMQLGYTQNYSQESIKWLLILSLSNGFITAMLALIFLFVLEGLFHVSSDMSLLLLSDYNHPLLKRMQFEAPGTYHHSLMVSTLAEQGAKAIGANPVQARVAALFHDIGKLTTPEYFTENNMGDNNKHEDLKPTMSCMLILNHVKDGVDLAIKNKLQPIILEAIRGHHGTDIIKYFYNKAKEISNGESINEGRFRYPGPLPQSKEVAIICLADVCEAASRSLQKPTHSKIDSLIWELFRSKIRNGQLNEADLTFAELAQLQTSFVSSLTTMLHGRISYPKEEKGDNDDDLFLGNQHFPTTKQKIDSQIFKRNM